MANYNKGVHGPYSGKVGHVVGANWHDIDYIRSLQRKSNKLASPAQVDQQFKFGMTQSIVSAMREAVLVGFQHCKKNETPVNAALSYNLAYAITGVSPNFTINFPFLSFSYGKLAGASDQSVTAAAAALLKVEWAVLGNANGTDTATIVVYNPAKQQFVIMKNAAMRSALEYDIQMPLDYTEDVVHVYISFVSPDGKVVSNTAYVGQVTVI